MKRFSLTALLISFLLIIGFAGYYPRWQQPGNETTTSYDVSGYYLYLPAVFIYQDIHQLEFYKSIQEKYRIAELESITTKAPEGNSVVKYPAGAAVLYSPFFFIAHGFAKASIYPEDGYSLPYQFLLGFGCLLYGLLGLWMLRRILLRYFNETTTGLTLLLIVAATNYLNYVAIDQAMTHNLLFTVYTFIVWCTIKFYEKPTLRYAIYLGLLCGLATIVRPTEIICVLIPLGWGIANWNGFADRVKFLFVKFKFLLAFLLAAVSVGSIQLIYWKITTGQFFFYSYQGEGFNWLHPYFTKAMFSYKKGWFVYTPFMLIIFPGFYFLYKYRRQLFFPAFIFTLLNIYIVFSWNNWWYGGSLGQRSVVQSYMILSFPVAAFIQAILRSGILLKVVFVLFALFCCWFNITLTLQAHNKNSIYEAENMNRTYFFQIFGKLDAKWDSKKYLDTNEIFRGERHDVQLIYTNDIEADTLHVDTNSVIGGKKSLFVDKDNQYTTPYRIPIPPKGSEWVRISADFFFPGKEWNTWEMTQFIVQFKNGEEVVKSKFIRVQRIMMQREVVNLNFDIRIPAERYNSIVFYLWNAESAHTVYMDNIHVESFK